MTIQTIRNQMPEYAKDIKLNLGKIFTDEAVEGLTDIQTQGIALTCAYATKNAALIDAVANQVNDTLDGKTINAAKAAATIMSMNNIYYRFVHLVSDPGYAKMPAGLRMNVIGNPGIDKIFFELMSLAVSAINGCGLCMDAHVKQIIQGGGSKQGVQSSIRIASVINATAQVLTLEQ